MLHCCQGRSAWDKTEHLCYRSRSLALTAWNVLLWAWRTFHRLSSRYYISPNFPSLLGRVSLISQQDIRADLVVFFFCWNSKCYWSFSHTVHQLFRRTLCTLCHCVLEPDSNGNIFWLRSTNRLPFFHFPLFFLLSTFEKKQFSMLWSPTETKIMRKPQCSDCFHWKVHIYRT